MSGVARSIDTEPDLDVEGRAIYGTRGVCSLCGFEGDTLAGPVELPGPKFVTGWRCCETSQCRARRMTPSTPPHAEEGTMTTPTTQSGRTLVAAFPSMEWDIIAIEAESVRDFKASLVGTQTIVSLAAYRSLVAQVEGLTIEAATEKARADALAVELERLRAAIAHHLEGLPLAYYCDLRAALEGKPRG